MLNEKNYDVIIDSIIYLEGYFFDTASLIFRRWAIETTGAAGQLHLIFSAWNEGQTQL